LRLRVLGCHGGELQGCRSTSFLVDGRLALDAGSLTQTLTLAELVKIDHVVVGHAHFDHVKDLPLLSDLLIGRRKKPLVIHASPESARALREHMFNNKLWPDFTRIPTPEQPILRIEVFEPGTPFTIGDYRVLAIPVAHPIESCGLVVTHVKERHSSAMSGDTGPTDLLWRELDKTRNLQALLLETSFPNALQGLADISGHFTPATMQRDLAKLTKHASLPVLLYHLKPAFLEPLTQEIQAIRSKRPLRILGLDEVYDFR